MRWFPLILSVSLVYAGCGPHRPPETAPGPAPGGTVRAYFDDSDLVRVTREVEGRFTPGTDPGLFERADPARGDAPLLEAVRFVDPEGADPGVLAGLGQIDLAVVYGRDAARMIDAAGKSGALVTRLPGWDRTYFLWLNPGPGRRWTRDPVFRGWLRGRIDRATLVDYLFGGEAVPIDGLLPETGVHDAVAPTSWRVPAGTRPRLALTFDGLDPNAAALASRIKAVIEDEGVEIALEGVETATLDERVSRQETHAALLMTRPPGLDPVLALQEVLQPLGEPVLDALEVLDRGSRERPGSAARATAAGEAERLVTFGDGPGRFRIVPLVRLHAWVFSAPGLRDVTRGDPAELSLATARWEP